MNLTQEQAIALAASKWWETMTPGEVAAFQLTTARLCMPFDLYHSAVEDALCRPVWTHEFAHPTQLLAELNREAPAPTMAEIIAKLPAAMRIVVVAPPSAD